MPRNPVVEDWLQRWRRSLTASVTPTAAGEQLTRSLGN